MASSQDAYISEMPQKVQSYYPTLKKFFMAIRGGNTGGYPIDNLKAAIKEHKNTLLLFLLDADWALSNPDQSHLSKEGRIVLRGLVNQIDHALAVSVGYAAARGNGQKAKPEEPVSLDEAEDEEPEDDS